MRRGFSLAVLIIAILSQRAATQPAPLTPIGVPAPEVIAPTPRATLGSPQTQPISGIAAPSSFDNASSPLGTTATGAAFTGSYTTLPRPVSDPVALSPSSTLKPCAESAPPPRRAESWFENLSIFIGVDGAKEPIDLGINANFGYRVGVNWGIPVFENVGLGIQIGSAFNYGQDALRLLPYVDGTVDRWQNFTTVGVFQRTKGGNASWGLVYDWRFDNYYDRISTGQWRAQLGYELNRDNEIGFWATVRDHGDSAAIGPFAFNVQPISQWNVYWRHVWPGEIATRLWVGLASSHSRFNLAVPGVSQINHPFTFGGDFLVPLSDYVALFGEAHVITPNDTGVISATVGIAIYPGSARGTARNRFAPLLPVANNATFALDVR